MQDISPFSTFNRVIRSTRLVAQEFLAERWETRPLELGEVLYEEGQTFTHAVFPHTGVLSLLAATPDGKSLEKASIGNEGFLGFTYLMGASGAISRTVVQVPGYASWVSMDDLDEAMERFVCVREAMLRYSVALISQLMETVYCNSTHTAEQRISRWLLQAHDRMEQQPFMLTQESLGLALGLRRATVSETWSSLMRSAAISYSRGSVAVLDRKVLRDHACDCYDRITAAALPQKRPGENTDAEHRLGDPRDGSGGTSS